MEIISNLKKIILFAFIAINIVACVDTDTVDQLPIDNSIVGIAQRSPNLTTLTKALNTTGLISTLSGAGPFTVFAPTDEAFTNFLKANNFTKLEDVPTPLLKEILLNHVLSGAKKSNDLKTEYVKTLGKGSASTTNTLSMFVEVNAKSEVKLNGVSKVTTPDIIPTNGVIHIVDAVIGLPLIVTHAAANPDFSTLVSVVTSKSGGTFGDQSAVATALTTNTIPLTVFAPTNKAFEVAVGTGGFANGAAPEVFTKVLQYHVTSAGNVLSNTLTEGQPVPMIIMPSQDIVITLVGGASIKDKSTNPASKIITVDVQCNNGIIHAIDRVLQPTL